MKAKKLIAPAVLLGFILSLLSSPCFATLKNQKEKDKKETKIEEKIFIPKEVKDVLEQGLAAEKGRQDIPFTIVKHLYLLARDDSMHNIFFFKVKNSDLGFAPPVLAGKQPEKKKEKEKEETPPVAQPEAPPQLQANFNVFLQFNRLEENMPRQVISEVYAPASLQVESASYDPEKEEIYSVGYPILAGNYLLAMAITSLDLIKIGTSYFKFSVPDAKSYVSELGTTPVFFVKEIKNLAAVETRPSLHKGSFTYSILEILPKIDNTFSPGESFELFFFIFGAKPLEQAQPTLQPQYNIEVGYEVKKGEEAFIRYQPTTYTNPLVSQPFLPMKQTVLIKSGTEERRETRDLAPGHYTFIITIADKISGISATKTIDFEMK